MLLVSARRIAAGITAAVAAAALSIMMSGPASGGPGPAVRLPTSVHTPTMAPRVKLANLHGVEATPRSRSATSSSHPPSPRPLGVLPGTAVNPLLGSNTYGVRSGGSPVAGRVLYGTDTGETHSCSCSSVEVKKNEYATLRTADGRWLKALAEAERSKAKYSGVPATWTPTKKMIRGLVAAEARSGDQGAPFYHDAQSVAAWLYREHVMESPGLREPNENSDLGRLFGPRRKIYLVQGQQVRVFGDLPRSRSTQISSVNFLVTGKSGEYFYYVLERDQGDGLDLIFAPYQRGLGMFLGLASPALQWGNVSPVESNDIAVADALLAE